MKNIINKKKVIVINVACIILTLQITSCKGQVKEELNNGAVEKKAYSQPSTLLTNTTFPQTHTNLNGMVSEFVRKIYQDKKGIYWFGTNGDGIICYNGKTLEKVLIDTTIDHASVRGIIEDKKGNLWFGTSSGLVKYNGKTFEILSEKEGLPSNEIWGLLMDSKGVLWIGTTKGVCHYNGEKFTNFDLPDAKVKNLISMLSDKLVFKFLEDREGRMWFATDGNGIFTYKDGKFNHLTKENKLTDNNVSDILQDSKGTIWIGTFFGGVSKFDGSRYSNFTKYQIIKGGGNV